MHNVLEVSCKEMYLYQGTLMDTLLWTAVVVFSIYYVLLEQNGQSQSFMHF